MVAGTRDRYFWLDWLRFLAALTVLLVHSKEESFVQLKQLPEDDQTILVKVFYLFAHLGNEAVLTFFVLSGFLVGGRALERMHSGRFSLVDYAIDRVTRIMLPLVPALFLTAVTLWLRGLDLDLPVFFGNVFSLQGIWFDVYGGNAPLWSLSYEVWFYLFVAVVAWPVMYRRWLLLALSCQVIVFLVFTKLSHVYLYCWLLGVFGYFVRPKNCLRLILLLMSLGFVLWSVASIQLSGRADATVWLAEWHGLLLSVDSARVVFSFGIVIFIQVLIGLEPKSEWVSKLERSGAWFAAFSYTLYLTHYPIIQLAKYWGYEQLDNISLVSVGRYIVLNIECIMVAVGLWYLFERNTRPLRGYIRKWFMYRTG